MDRITLILVPDERSPVRRFRVPRALLRYGVFGVALAVVLGAAGFADWVRLRLDSRDVAALRSKTAQDQEQLVDLARDLRGLEDQLGRLLELERKVRVIADLPAALPEADAPAHLGGARRAGGGQGGGADEAEAGASADVSAPVPPGAGTPAGESAVDLPLHPAALGLDGAALRRVRDKAARLAARMELRGGAFEDLVRRLHGLRERLAATPSIWPADGWVTSAFGWRTSPFTGRRQFHSGLDIAADAGTEILAAARGRVAFSGAKGALGQTVILDHGFGFRTTYGHASALHVRAGQQVERGERVAAVGNSGRSSGPHLHYAVSVKGRSVDPSDYVLD
jgi:murein DD-endopeptidase MepM/ murein hydrolase activator NlpD